MLMFNQNTAKDSIQFLWPTTIFEVRMNLKSKLLCNAVCFPEAC